LFLWGAGKRGERGKTAKTVKWSPKRELEARPPVCWGNLHFQQKSKKKVQGDPKNLTRHSSKVKLPITKPRYQCRGTGGQGNRKGNGRGRYKTTPSIGKRSKRPKNRQSKKNTGDADQAQGGRGN